MVAENWLKLFRVHLKVETVANKQDDISLIILPISFLVTRQFQGRFFKKDFTDSSLTSFQRRAGFIPPSFMTGCWTRYDPIQSSSHTDRQLGPWWSFKHLGWENKSDPCFCYQSSKTWEQPPRGDERMKHWIFFLNAISDFFLFFLETGFPFVKFCSSSVKSPC